MASAECGDGYDSSEVEGNSTRLLKVNWHVLDEPWDELPWPLLWSLFPFVTVVACELSGKIHEVLHIAGRRVFGTGR
jgi:hypothetical protein